MSKEKKGNKEIKKPKKDSHKKKNKTVFLDKLNDHLPKN